MSRSEKFRKFVQRVWSIYILIIGGGIVVILALVDYIGNLGVASYLLDLLSRIASLIARNVVFSLILLSLIWLFSITVFIRRLKHRVEEASETKPTRTTQMVEDIVNERLFNLEKEFKEHSENVDSQLKSIRSSFSSVEHEYLSDKKWLLTKQMEDHSAKKQMGELSSTIDLLRLAIRVNNKYDMEDALGHVLGYLRSHGPEGRVTVWLHELRDLVSKLPPDFKYEKEEIERLLAR